MILDFRFTIYDLKKIFTSVVLLLCLGSLLTVQAQINSGAQQNNNGKHAGASRQNDKNKNHPAAGVLLASQTHYLPWLGGNKEQPDQRDDGKDEGIPGDHQRHSKRNIISHHQENQAGKSYRDK